MKKYLIAAGGLLILLGAGCSSTPTGETLADVSSSNENLTIIFDEPVTEIQTFEFPGVLPFEEISNKKIRITTAKGDIVFELFADTAPKTVSNFVYLINGGYYDGLTFHRREEGFVIQGGDPNGDGTGGPGYEFEDEVADSYQYERGIVAMANRGPNTNGSQFFIMLGNVPLPKAYTIFGRVTEGMEVVDQIQVGDKMDVVVVETK
ncbi:peptidylprolyl isomerase [Candidatus Uhrbacteria bacterium]|nr:peptidylprolyl isomerase [Candidatus Uhrbacteria bacterium]